MADVRDEGAARGVADAPGGGAGPWAADSTAWDELLDTLDHAVAAPDRLPDPAEIAGLVRRGMDEGSVDRELEPDACGRWIAALARTHAAVVAEHPDLDPDTELALLRLVVTRWLHPRRLDRD